MTKEEALKPYEKIAQIRGINFSVIIFNDALKAIDTYCNEMKKNAFKAGCQFEKNTWRYSVEENDRKYKEALNNIN
jgi:hypothetical protein